MNKITSLPFDTPKQKATTILKLFFYHFVGGLLSWGFAMICSDIGGLYWAPGLIFGVFFFIMRKPIIKQSYSVSDCLFILVSIIAYFIAIYLFFNYGDQDAGVPNFNFFSSGFIGTVLLSIGFYFVRKLTDFLRLFFITIFIGGVGGLIFFNWLARIDDFYFAFAMWQGCVGTTLNMGYLIAEKRRALSVDGEATS